MLQAGDGHEKLTISYVGVGANVTSSKGSLRLTLRRSIAELASDSVSISSISSFFHSPAFPAGSGPDFLNAVVELSTDLSANMLLHFLHEIEGEFGRVRDTRWSPRVLDLDLLAHGNEILPNLETLEHWQNLPLAAQMSESPSELILPHPRLQDRVFVLKPWAEIAPDWIHPATGISVRQMLANLPDEEKASTYPI